MTPKPGGRTNSRATPGGRRWSWPITLVGSLALIALLVVSLWGYDRWANSVPPYQPSAGPMPSPNGYDRALALIAELPPEPQDRRLYPRWPEAPPAALQRALAPAQPSLGALRDTFQLQWRRPAPRPFLQPTLDLAQFRRCARFFKAESLLAEDNGDPGTAMRWNLDNMEMAALTGRGGSFIPLLVGAAIHAIGLAGAERLVLELPATDLLRDLRRVRRIRHEWQRFPGFLVAEREVELAEFTEAARQYQHPTPIQTLGFAVNLLKSMRTMSAVEEEQAFEIWLTPKRSAISTVDRYFRALITEYGKPVRRRRAVVTPTAPIFRNILMTPGEVDWGEAKWWRPRVDLDLLEVALAVRLYRLKNGQYPSRLAEIPQRWLPAIPVDPWGQPVAYRLKKGNPVIYSFGPDGRDDGGRPVDARQLSQTTQGDLVWGALARRAH